MLFTGSAVHASQLLEKQRGILVDETASKGRILLLDLVVGCYGLSVQQHIIVIQAPEDCIIKISSAQVTFDGSGLFHFRRRRSDFRRVSEPQRSAALVLDRKPRDDNFTQWHPGQTRTRQAPLRCWLQDFSGKRNRGSSRKPCCTEPVAP